MEILASLPGVGSIVLATLLAEAWDPLQRRDYAALRSLTRVAPVTKRSGKSYIARHNAAFASSPEQMDRYRDRFTLGVAKDDSRDARPDDSFLDGEGIQAPTGYRLRETI